jgi:hypothetical protein
LKAKADYLAKCSGDTNRISVAIDIILTRAKGQINSPLKYLHTAVPAFFDSPADMELLARRLRHLADSANVHPLGIKYAHPEPFQEQDPEVARLGAEWLKTHPVKGKPKR